MKCHDELTQQAHPSWTSTSPPLAVSPNETLTLKGGIIYLKTTTIHQKGERNASRRSKKHNLA